MPLSTEEYNEFRGLWEEIKGTLETQTQEIKTLGDASQETKNKYAAMDARIGLLDASHNARPPLTTAPTETKSGSMRAFEKAIRKGYHTLNQDERKMLPTSNAVDAPAIPGNFFEEKGLTVVEDTTGGFLAPPEFIPEIIKGVILYSPIRQYARVRQTSARSVQMPKRTGTITAQWVGEKPTRTETTGWTIGRVEIPLQEMYALVLISEQDLEDPVLDIESQIRDEFSEQFGVAEGAALVAGDGAVKPQGLLTASAGIPIDKSGTSGVITTDSLMTCAYNLKDSYAQNAKWYMRRQTIGGIRQLRYGSTDQRYIWDPGIAQDNPSTLLGYSIIETPDMPAVGAASMSILFGDMARCYTVVTRVGMTFKRLAERWVENSQVGVYARMRIGAQVTIPEAMRIYQLTT